MSDHLARLLVFFMFIGVSFMVRVYKEKNIELKKENDKLKEVLEYYNEKYNN